MSARATIRTGDLNRYAKTARTFGVIVVLPDGTRIIPADLTEAANTPLPTDPLDAELAQWAAKRGYD
jgi:hypothetical protein